MSGYGMCLVDNFSHVSAVRGAHATKSGVACSTVLMQGVSTDRDQPAVARFNPPRLPCHWMVMGVVGCLVGSPPPGKYRRSRTPLRFTLYGFLAGAR